LGIDRGDSAQAFVRKHLAGNIADMRRQIAHMAIAVEDARPFPANLAKSYELHVRFPITAIFDRRDRLCLSMIFPENRFPLFGIMLKPRNI
jgi:hypothetical protein